MREVAARAAPAASLEDSTTIHSPSFASEFQFPRRGSFNHGPWKRALLVHLEAQRNVRRTFDSVDAHFSVALRGMRIARGKKRAAIKHRQIERGAGAQLAHIHVAAENARRPRAKFAVFRGRHAHHAAEGTQRHDSRRDRFAHLSLQFPEEEKRLRKTLLEKTEAAHHARPAPAFVRHFQHVHLKNVARLGSLDKNRGR